MLRRRAIGVLAESYSKWERRAPLTPLHVSKIVERLQTDVLVQPSSKRIFTDAEYAAAGATITQDLSSAGVVSAAGVEAKPLATPDPHIKVRVR